MKKSQVIEPYFEQIGTLGFIIRYFQLTSYHGRIPVSALFYTTL